MKAQCVPFPPIVPTLTLATISTAADTGFDSFPASGDIRTHFSRREDAEANKCKV